MAPTALYARLTLRVLLGCIFIVKKKRLDIFCTGIGRAARLHLFGLAFVSISGLACAQKPELLAQESAKVTSTQLALALEEIRTKHNLPGLIAGQFDTQKIQHIAAVGFRRAGSTDPLLVSHPMHLGSCTKSMTATLIAMAVDEGILQWHSTLGEVFASDPKVTDSPWANVTIEQILHHTSGAPANPPWSQFAVANVPIQIHRRNVLHWWMQQPRNSNSKEEKKTTEKKPAFLYSNLGYMTLGAVLEELRQEPWEDQIRARLFEPLGMKSAGFGVPSKSLGDKVPWGHVRPAGILLAVERDNPPTLGPAGTVFANMEDWVGYLQFHLRNKATDTPGLKLSEESFEYLHKTQEQQEYAGGWIVLRRSWSQGPIYHHNGSNTYWYSVVFLAPKEGRGIFAACNLGLDAAEPCDQALQWILKNLPHESPSH
jgi:CubicO group peptidase (beta-lactamase class C family)